MQNVPNKFTFISKMHHKASSYSETVYMAVNDGATVRVSWPGYESGLSYPLEKVKQFIENHTWLVRDVVQAPTKAEEDAAFVATTVALRSELARINNKMSVLAERATEIRALLLGEKGAK